MLRVAGAAVLLLSVVMLAVFPVAPGASERAGFISPVVGFELASEPEHVLGILGAPGRAPERPAAVAGMDLGNRIDFLFMIAYPALYLGIALLAAGARAARRPARQRPSGLAVRDVARRPAGEPRAPGPRRR